MIKEELVSFKTAKLAREKGFDEICINHYNIGEWNIKRKPEKGVRNSEIIIGDCTAPTQTILQKWLREKFDIHIVIYPVKTDSFVTFDYKVYKETKLVYEDEKSYKNYEETLEDALFTILNLTLISA